MIGDNLARALQVIEHLPEPPVIKADGLCDGKGVVVSSSFEEASQAAVDMLNERVFGDAGNVIVIEERLEGVEGSIMALVDGESVILLQAARDYKRASAEPGAPNTGGMGAYSPLPDVGPEVMAVIKRDILDWVVSGMMSNGTPYHGLLYAGIMLTADGPKLLEINCRFGDPETQVVLPRLDCDIVPALLASTQFGGFEDQHIKPLQWKDESAVCVVMTSGGYPGKYDIGFPIKGLDALALFGDVVVYEAGTELREKQKVTSGGRVLGVVGMGKSLEAAQNAAYEGVELIFYAKEVHRSDIGD